jgi:peptide/nickel transport system ATP-binding protein
VPGDLCVTTLPDLTPARAGGNHTKRCHIANPDEVYVTEVLAEIAPDVLEEQA